MGHHRNPHAKVFDSPKHPQVPPRDMTLATECSICFLSFICENTHKVWYKIFKIELLMIFDLLTSPQGHQFDSRMKMLLAFCCACHPRWFDMPHDHVWKKNWTPGHPQCPKVPPLGHDPGDRIKISFDMICIFHLVRTHTKFGIKCLKLTGYPKFNDIWPLTSPKVTSLTLGWKLYLHSVLLVILVDLICHMTMFEKNNFLITWAPLAPQSPTPGDWPRQQNENPIW